MRTWIKLHTEIIDDPKLGRLSFADKGLWLYLLALAGRLDHRDQDGNPTGELGTLDDIVWLLRTSLAEIQPSIERMVNANMLHYQDDILFVTHFAQRQANDSDAERARNYRASRTVTRPEPQPPTPTTPPSHDRHATVTQASRTRHTTVTHASHDRHHIESEIESETESEQEQNNNNSRTDNTRARDARARIAAVAAARSVAVAAANSPSPLAERGLGGEVRAERGSGSEVDHRDTDSPLSTCGEGGRGGEVYPDDTIASTQSEIIRATNALTNIGIEPTTTRKLIQTQPYAHIIGWTNYANNQPGLQNPAGYVIKMLKSGSPPPREQRKTWFTPEEEQLYFGPHPKTCTTCTDD